MMLKTAALFFDSGDEFKASQRDTCCMMHATEDLGFTATASAEKVSQTLTANLVMIFLCFEPLVSPYNAHLSFQRRISSKTAKPRTQEHLMDQYQMYFSRQEDPPLKKCNLGVRGNL